MVMALESQPSPAIGHTATPTSDSDEPRLVYCSDSEFPVTTEEQFNFVAQKYNDLDRYTKHLILKNTDLCVDIRERAMKLIEHFMDVKQEFIDFATIASLKIRDRIPFTVVELVAPGAVTPKPAVLQAQGEANLEDNVQQVRQHEICLRNLEQAYGLEVMPGMGYRMQLPFTIAFTPTPSASGAPPVHNALSMDVKSATDRPYRLIPPSEYMHKDGACTTEKPVSPTASASVGEPGLRASPGVPSVMTVPPSTPVRGRKNSPRKRKADNTEHGADDRAESSPRKKKATKGNRHQGRSASPNPPAGLQNSESPRKTGSPKSCHAVPPAVADPTPSSSTSKPSVGTGPSDEHDAADVPNVINGKGKGKAADTNDPSPPCTPPQADSNGSSAPGYYCPLPGVKRPFNQHFQWPLSPGTPNPRGLRRQGGFYFKTHPHIFWDPSFGNKPLPHESVLIADCMPPWRHYVEGGDDEHMGGSSSSK